MKYTEYLKKHGKPAASPQAARDVEKLRVYSKALAAGIGALVDEDPVKETALKMLSDLLIYCSASIQLESLSLGSENAVEDFIEDRWRVCVMFNGEEIPPSTFYSSPRKVRNSFTYLECHYKPLDDGNTIKVGDIRITQNAEVIIVEDNTKGCLSENEEYYRSDEYKLHTKRNDVRYLDKLYKPLKNGTDLLAGDLSLDEQSRPYILQTDTGKAHSYRHYRQEEPTRLSVEEVVVSTEAVGEAKEGKGSIWDLKVATLQEEHPKEVKYFGDRYEILKGSDQLDGKDLMLEINGERTTYSLLPLGRHPLRRTPGAVYYRKVL